MTTKLNRVDALVGALVADAASMGLHWIYDQEHIAALAGVGDVLFRQPDAHHYADKKAYFAHAGRQAGQLSHYGESSRIVGQLALEKAYSPAAHRQRFMQSFGPCGSYVGYADRPTQALVAKMLTEGDALGDVSGSDDDQMPTLCVLPGLFAADASLDTIQQAARVISTHADGQAGVSVLFTCMSMLLDGVAMHDALVVSAKAIAGNISGRTSSEQAGVSDNNADISPMQLSSLLIDAVGLNGYQPLAAANQFGMPCHMPQGLPLVWHLLAHASDFESAVRDNILCGGDTCGRAMALGAMAGLIFGVPDKLVKQLEPGIVESLNAPST